MLELTDGRRIAESFAIVYFLARDTPWWPEDLFKQSQVLAWLSFEQERHMKPLAQLRLHLSLRKDRLPSDPTMLSLARLAQEALQILEAQLSVQGASRWVATADHPSLADVALYPYTKLSPLSGMDLSLFPAVEAWLSRFESLPGYQPLFPNRPELTLSTAELTKV